LKYSYLYNLLTSHRLTWKWRCS